MNYKTINVILSYFDEQTINLIINTLFSVQMWNIWAISSILAYSAAVVIRLNVERRVDWILIIATLTLPISLFFAFA
jgi:hypothetical protein